MSLHPNPSASQDSFSDPPLAGGSLPVGLPLAVKGAVPGTSLPAAQSQTPVTKPGFWGSLRLFERSEIKGDARQFAAINHGLERAWNQPNPLCWILARVRCEILKATPHQYERLHKHLPRGTLLGLELPHSFEQARYNPESIHRLLLGWEKLAHSYQEREPALAYVLREAKREVLQLLTSKYGDGVYGVLARWRHEVGPKQFDTATGYNDSTMWNRRKVGAMFEFDELVRIAKAIGFVPPKANPRQVLVNPRMKELGDAWMRDAQALERPAPISNLFRLLNAWGVQTSASALKKEPRIALYSFETDKLCRFRMISWQRIKPVFVALKDAKVIGEPEYEKLNKEWCKAYAKTPPSHEDRLLEVQRERGLSVGHLAQALQLLHHKGNPATETIVKYLRYDRKSRFASPGVLSHLVGRSDQEVTELLNLKRAEIASQLRRAGSLIKSPCAVERELWCVDYEDLPYSKADIQSLEWGTKTTLNPEEVLAEIKRVGESRAKKALSGMLAIREFRSVRGMVAALRNAKGLGKLSDLCGTSDELLSMIQAGVHVPALPKIAQFLARAGHQLPVDVELDWRDQLASHLLARNQSDVERVIHAFMMEHGTSLRSVKHSSKSGASKLTLRVRWLGEVGIFSPKALPAFLQRLGLNPKSPQALFIQSVNAEGSIASGLRAWLKEMDKTPEHSWIRDALVEGLKSASEASVPEAEISAIRELILGYEGGHRRSVVLSRYLEARSYLPGVAIREIERALNDSTPKSRSRMEELLAQCRKGRINRDDILFSVRNCRPSRGRPRPLLPIAMKRGVFSPACPRGVLVCLGAADLRAAQESLARERTLIKEHLRPFAIPGIDVVVEMMLWGLEPSNLEVSFREFDQMVWSTPKTVLPPRLKFNPTTLDASREALVQQARQQGAIKVATALRELIKRRRVVDPAGVSELAEENVKVTAAKSSSERFFVGRVLPHLAAETKAVTPPFSAPCSCARRS